MADREKLKAEVRELAHKPPEWWAEVRGGNSIARTINAVFDIIDESPNLEDDTIAREHGRLRTKGYQLANAAGRRGEDPAPLRAFLEELV